MNMKGIMARSVIVSAVSLDANLVNTIEHKYQQQPMSVMGPTHSGRG